MRNLVRFAKQVDSMRTHMAAAMLTVALVVIFLPGRASATTVNMSNGPTVVRATKEYPAGTGVQMARITAIPNASSVNVYMEIGSSCDSPQGTSATKYGQQVNSIPSLGAFNGWAQGNCVAVRGNHYYNANVNNVIPK